MAEMTARQRVITALNHEEPDQVPTALWGGPYGLVDELYLKMVDALELGETSTPFRSGHNISYIDDRILAILGTDTRYVWPGASPSSPQLALDDPDSLVDGYGQPWKQAFPYYYPDQGILVNATTIEEIDRVVTWPDTDHPRWTTGVRERGRYLREKTDCYVIGRMVTSHGPFQTASDLRGLEHFMIDLALNPDFAQALIDRVTDTIDGLLRGYLQNGGDFFDMVELPGDDYASNKGLMISPQTFRRFFRPALQRLVETVKAYRSDLKVMFHSDGQISQLLPDLIDIGVDVIHPLEPVAGMDQAAVKRDFGDKLAFLGGIDITRAMPGSRQDVIAEARRRIDLLAAGGGYILAPANHLQADVAPENVLTLYRTTQEYGRYPLGGQTIG
jgi:uroporphyrinogen decarboxylase